MYTSSYVWAKVLTYMEGLLTDTVVSNWFEDAEVVELTDQKMVLCSHDTFRREIIETRFVPYIQDAMRELFQKNVEVLVLSEDQLEQQRRQDMVRKPRFIEYNPHFTFDSFIVGPSNRFAHAAAIAVANRPAETYNPLFIYGPSGLGKTHLLYAIAGVINAAHPDHNIVYIKGDEFTNELIEALREGRNQEFRSKYRNADLFLVDDIQFIAGKESTQEEFFHTFNKLYEEHKQIVMTSDRKPSDMLTLEDRLKSRFEWGLLADIQPPDYETRMAILKNKAKSLGLQLDDDVCNYIAINVTNNVRQIEGTVKKILAYRDLNDMPLDLPNISRAINDMFTVEGNALPTPSLIISQVCKFYSVDEAVLRGSQKSKGIAEARQMSMYLIRKLTNLSLPDIGKEFGKDHSTVLYNIRKVEMALKKGDSNLQNNIRDITANINSCL